MGRASRYIAACVLLLCCAAAAHAQNTPTQTPTATPTAVPASADLCSYGAIGLGSMTKQRAIKQLTGAAGPSEVVAAPGGTQRIYILDIVGSSTAATTGGLYARGTTAPIRSIATAGAATLSQDSWPTVPLCLPANTALDLNQTGSGTLSVSVGYAIGNAEATRTPWPTATPTVTPH